MERTDHLPDGLNPRKNSVVDIKAGLLPIDEKSDFVGLKSGKSEEQKTRVGARSESTKRCEYSGPKFEASSNVPDTPLFAARFARRCHYLVANTF